MTLFLLLPALLLSAPAEAGKKERPPNVAEVRLPESSTEGVFTFGPGDRFSITVFQHPDLSAELTVSPDGTVTFPLIGRLQVAGRGYSELVQVLEEGLRRYYEEVSVAVNVLDVNSSQVFVVGEVLSPAVLQVTGELTVLEALVRSGGINPNAKTDNLLLVRGGLEEPELYTVDVDRLLTGDLSQNVALREGDIIVVPTKTIVNVERFFRHVSGILGPFVSATQIYRNVNLRTVPVIEDAGTDQ